MTLAQKEAPGPWPCAHKALGGLTPPSPKATSLPQSELSRAGGVGSIGVSSESGRDHQPATTATANRPWWTVVAYVGAGLTQLRVALGPPPETENSFHTGTHTHRPPCTAFSTHTQPHPRQGWALPPQPFSPPAPRQRTPQHPAPLAGVTHMVPEVVGTMGMSSASVGMDHGICNWGASSRMMIFLRTEGAATSDALAPAPTSCKDQPRRGPCRCGCGCCRGPQAGRP